VIDRMAADERECVWLDMRTVDPRRFPNVAAMLSEAGIDPAREPVPVAPAAHYLMGGIVTDLDGRSTLAGLYAVGECACTGLHGANRLASNSLSECFVFGARAAGAAVAETVRSRPQPPTARFQPPTEETRDAMWLNAGPRRTPERLQALLTDHYPLARLVATSALARRESRGAHRRGDFPRPDPRLDGVHLVVEPGGGVREERWA
jgi:L-aspartate oxidase